MPIIKMQKMTLAAMITGRARVMRRLQRLGCVEIIEGVFGGCLIPPAETARRDELAAWIARLDAVISKLAPHDLIKRGAFAQKPGADEATVAGILAWRGQARQIADRLDAIGPLRAGAFEREASAKNLINALKPWAGLAVPLERIGETRDTVSGLLVIPERAYDAFASAALALDVPAAFSEINRTGGKVYIMMATHKCEAAAMDLLINEIGAIRARLNGLYGSALININQAEAQLSRAMRERADLNREITQLGREIHALRTLRDVEAAELDRLNAMSRLRVTRSAFVLTAWAPFNRIAAIEQAIKETLSTYELEFCDPGDSENPPIINKNFKSLRSFKPLKYNTRYVEILNH
jgi:vacuolar-type H+-ATPase subunit I/STV1